MHVLVTGATGFVGRHAVRRLVAAGHRVTGVSHDEAPAIAGVTAVVADVRDGAALRRAVGEATPDGILHLAGIAYVPDARKDPRLAFDVNAGGTLNLLLAVARETPRARVLVVSSAEVYGQVTDPSEMPLVEDRPLRPVTHYGATKAAAEHLARAHAADGLDVVTLRPFNHVGPGQRGDFVLASFARQVAALERSVEPAVLRHGNLDAVRDFLDVRDIVVAYERALTAPAGALLKGEAYNLCSGHGVRIGDLVDRLAARARRPVTTEIDRARLRPIDVPVFVGSAERFRAAVGFAPVIPLDQTLDDVLEEARALSAAGA